MSLFRTSFHYYANIFCIRHKFHYQAYIFIIGQAFGFFGTNYHYYKYLFHHFVIQILIPSFCHNVIIIKAFSSSRINYHYYAYLFCQYQACNFIFGEKFHYHMHLLCHYGSKNGKKSFIDKCPPLGSYPNKSKQIPATRANLGCKSPRVGQNFHANPQGCTGGWLWIKLIHALSGMFFPY